MKKIFTLLLFAATFVSAAFAQSQRMVLVEHFTQASCGPCASINPQVQPILDNNIDNVISIKYQTSWPGFDPMHDHNPVEVNSRVSYYNVRSVPNSVLDGFGPSSSISTITQPRLNTRINASAPFSIDLQHSFSPSLDKITATMTIEATQAYSGNLAAHIAIIEKEISFGSSPGSNGETEFYNVMKKMLPDAQGTALKEDWAVGDKQTIELSWDIENVYKLDELGAVAFIQNNQSKIVLQADYSAPALAPSGPNDGLVSRVSPEGDFAISGACGTELSPLLEVMNGGSEKLTSLDIYYRVNGGAEQHYKWEGFLNFLQRSQVVLPAIPFAANAENWMDIRTENPNGQQDANTGNDDYRHIFPPAPSTTSDAIVEIRPASAPGEITWKIFNSSDEEVASGGPYTSIGNHRDNVTLSEDDCYTLSVVNGANGFNGRVRILNSDEATRGEFLLSQSGTFDQDFGTYLVTKTDDLLDINTLFVYPNPAANASVVEFEMKQSAKIEFVLINAIGQKVRTHSKELNSGLHQESIDVSSFPNGLYFLQLKTQEGMITRQLTIER